MKLVLGLLLFLASIPPALACSCGGGGTFMQMASGQRLVVLGTVLSHEAHGLDFQIEDVYRGREERNVIRVWGDDGASCRANARNFQDGSRHIFTLVAASTYIRPEVAAEEYALEGCGVMTLAVSDDDSVYLDERQARMSLSRIEAEIRTLDRMPIAQPARDERIAAALGVADPPAPSPLTITCGVGGTTTGPTHGVSLLRSETIGAGRFEPEGAASAETVRQYEILPDLCRLIGFYIPRRDLVIPFELWIPGNRWNGTTIGGLADRALAGGSAAMLTVADAASLTRGVGGFILDWESPDEGGELVAGFQATVDRMWRSQAREFLGSTRSFNVVFLTNISSARFVDRGPGRLAASVTRNGTPVAGLQLRIALNDNLWGPWMTTDAAGVYSFDLPDGEYQIKGYEIDRQSADRLLAGAIDSPRGNSLWPKISVTEGETADGLSLSYVDPIEVLWPVGTVTAEQVQSAAWVPHPGAVTYDFMIGTRFRRTAVVGIDPLWRGEALTSSSLDLSTAALSLDPGTYVIQIYALDAKGDPISHTVNHEIQVVR